MTQRRHRLTPGSGQFNQSNGPSSFFPPPLPSVQALLHPNHQERNTRNYPQPYNPHSTQIYELFLIRCISIGSSGVVHTCNRSGRCVLRLWTRTSDISIPPPT